MAKRPVKDNSSTRHHLNQVAGPTQFDCKLSLVRWFEFLPPGGFAQATEEKNWLSKTIVKMGVSHAEMAICVKMEIIIWMVSLTCFPYCCRNIPAKKVAIWLNVIVFSAQIVVNERNRKVGARRC